MTTHTHDQFGVKKGTFAAGGVDQTVAALNIKFTDAQLVVKERNKSLDEAYMIALKHDKDSNRAQLFAYTFLVVYSILIMLLNVPILSLYAAGAFWFYYLMDTKRTSETRFRVWRALDAKSDALTELMDVTCTLADHVAILDTKNATTRSAGSFSN